MRTDSAAAFARQDRTNLQAFDADLHQVVRDLLVDQLVRFDDLLFLLDRVRNGFAAHATNDARGEVDYFFVAFVDGTNRDAVNRAAIDLVDDYVLRSVDQLTSQVT